jgi:hypothetical protein
MVANINELEKVEDMKSTEALWEISLMSPSHGCNITKMDKVTSFIHTIAI